MTDLPPPPPPAPAPVPEPTGPAPKKPSKFLIGLLTCGGLFVLILIIGALAPKQDKAIMVPSSETTTTEPATTATAATPTTAAPPTTPAPTAPPTTAAPAETASQRNARKSAQSYLGMRGFSRQGLIDQLSSQYGDKFSVEDATYAVDSLSVDWNEQAVRAAESYLKMKGFSHQGLVDQLSSQYGDKFTREEAEAGVTGAGL